VKLHPEDLTVTSFDTGPTDVEQFGSTTTLDPNDPTPGTWCRICPVDTNVL
jgi:hypothetical protein